MDDMAHVRYISNQPRTVVIYASPTPENVAPTYPKKPVILQPAEKASFTVALEVWTPLIKFCGSLIKKPISNKEISVIMMLLGPE